MFVFGLEFVFFVFTLYLDFFGATLDLNHPIAFFNSSLIIFVDILSALTVKEYGSMSESELLSFKSDNSYKSERWIEYN